MAFALLSRSGSQTQRVVKPQKWKSARRHHSAGSRVEFEKPAFQAQASVRAKVPAIQPKLKIGEANDKFEHEADRVSEQVMRMPDSEMVGISGTRLAVQRKCADCASGHDLCPECTAEEEQLHRKPLTTAMAPPGQGLSQLSAQISTMRGRGRPLLPATRAFFEPRFRYDFSQVRVHTDTGAAETARAVHARAFAVGSQIVFARGEYAPGTQEGRKLLAHELAHTVQQERAPGWIQRQGFEEGIEPSPVTLSPHTAWQLSGPLRHLFPLERYMYMYLCLRPLYRPMHEMTLRWIEQVCWEDPDRRLLEEREVDAFGHCWIACEGSRRCGIEETAEANLIYEILRELGYRGPHNSFRQDLNNEALGRRLSGQSGRCSELCYRAHQTGLMDLTAPITRRYMDCTILDWSPHESS